MEVGGILAWRIIPFSKWLITIVIKSPEDRVGLVIKWLGLPPELTTLQVLG